MNGDGNQQVPQNKPVAEPGWSYKQESKTPYSPPPENSPSPSAIAPSDGLEWTASEFIAHQKGPGWYAIFGLASLLVVICTYFLTREIVPTILIAMAVGIFGWTAARPPRVIKYRIEAGGLYVGGQYYPFQDYKAFSIVDEGAFSNLMLWPMKRFGLPVGVYYDPAQEEQIINLISQHLPMQQPPSDLVENAMRRIRF